MTVKFTACSSADRGVRSVIIESFGKMESEYDVCSSPEQNDADFLPLRRSTTALQALETPSWKRAWSSRRLSFSAGGPYEGESCNARAVRWFPRCCL